MNNLRFCAMTLPPERHLPRWILGREPLDTVDRVTVVDEVDEQATANENVPLRRAHVEQAGQVARQCGEVVMRRIGDWKKYFSDFVR